MQNENSKTKIVRLASKGEEGKSAPIVAKKTRNRKSENARAVAKDVVETVLKGEKVVMGKIIRKHGYSESMATKPQRVTQTKAYKEVIDPVVDGMKKAQANLIAELNRPGRIATFKRAKLNDVATTLKVLTHDIQLLSGGDTERDTSINKYIDKLNEMMNNEK